MSDEATAKDTRQITVPGWVRDLALLIGIVGAGFAGFARLEGRVEVVQRDVATVTARVEAFTQKVHELDVVLARQESARETREQLRRATEDHEGRIRALEQTVRAGPAPSRRQR